MSPAKSSQLFVFAHLDTAFVPAGKLTLTEQVNEVTASEFVYGLKYLERTNALELDPLGLSLANKSAMRGQRLFHLLRLLISALSVMLRPMLGGGG